MAYHQHNGKRRLIVLVDMDGVMCDFEGHMLSEFRKKHPGDPYVKMEDRRTFYMAEQYETVQPGLGVKLKKIMCQPGFFDTMMPIPGAVDALKEMAKIEGVEVFLCTTPIAEPSHCAPEKYEWVNRHLGKDWMMRVILTTDKTLVTGDLLIDDKHEVTGLVSQPSWDHILFTQCHNRHLALDGKSKFTGRLSNWTDGSWRLLVDTYHKRIVRPGANS